MSHDKWHVGTFCIYKVVFGSYFRIMSNPSQKAICSSRNKSKMAPNENCFFRKNWGWDQQLEVKGYVLVVKVHFFKKLWKKEDQCTSIFHFADRPEVPYEVDFRRKSFANKKRFPENVVFLGFWGGWFWAFAKKICKFVSSLAWNLDGKCRQGPN